MSEAVPLSAKNLIRFESSRPWTRLFSLRVRRGLAKNLRHGESTWNKENRFTGRTDVDLSQKGRDEALEGGRALKKAGYLFDVAYTSVLKRAIRTLWIVLDDWT